jgi:hypothetical protein
MRGVTDDAPARNPAAHEPRVLLSRAQRTLRNCALCEPLTHDAARVPSLEISIKDFNGL